MLQGKQFPFYFVAEVVAEHVAIALTKTGGDGARKAENEIYDYDFYHIVRFSVMDVIFFRIHKKVNNF